MRNVRVVSRAVFLLLLAAITIILCTALPQEGPPAPTPSMAVPSVSLTPSAEPSATPTSSPTPATLEDPAGDPESLTIKRGDQTIVAPMAFAPRIVSDNNWFSSKSGYVAWWDAKPDSPKPGQLSSYMSLITGHVMSGKTWYPLKALMPDDSGNPGGHTADLLYIQYSSGDVVVAKADEDSHDIVKTDLNTMPEYTTNGGQLARTIRLTTCDRTGEIRPDGHAVNNVVQRYTVVAIIKYGT